MREFVKFAGKVYFVSERIRCILNKTKTLYAFQLFACNDVVACSVGSSLARP